MRARTGTLLALAALAALGCASSPPDTAAPPAVQVGDADLPAFDTPPELIKYVEPEYPKYAKEHHIGGRVTLRITVKTDGTVGEVTVQSSTDAMFNDAAVDAARQFRFKPARRDGKAVKSVVAVPIQFR